MRAVLLRLRWHNSSADHPTIEFASLKSSGDVNQPSLEAGAELALHAGRTVIIETATRNHWPTLL